MDTLKQPDVLSSREVLSQEMSSPEIIIEKISDSKLITDVDGEMRYYKVQWSTWECENRLKKHCQKLIDEFWNENMLGEDKIPSKNSHVVAPTKVIDDSKKTNHNLNNIETSDTNGSNSTEANHVPKTKRNVKSRVQKIVKSNGQTTHDQVLTSSVTQSDGASGKHNRMVTCVSCGISYNNSFYKEKCRFCTNTCKECGKSFKRPSALRNHIEGVHEKSRKHRCDLCLKAFTTRHYLTNHLLKHKSERKHECDVCLKKYKDITKLKRHKLIHSGIKEFKCNVCHREFQQNEALKKHMLLHTEGPRRFQCLLCKKGFNHKVSLKSHMLKLHDKNEQQAAVMIGLWKQYQQNEACSENFVNDQNDVLSKALNDVVMKPQDGGQNLSLENHLNDIPLLNFGTTLNLP